MGTCDVMGLFASRSGVGITEGMGSDLRNSDFALLKFVGRTLCVSLFPLFLYNGVEAHRRSAAKTECHRELGLNHLFLTLISQLNSLKRFKSMKSRSMFLEISPIKTSTLPSAKTLPIS